LQKSDDYTAVFIDFEMPGVNGIEATKMIRNKLNLKGLQIIGITGNVEESIVKSSLENGMNRVATKPMTLECLSNMLKELEII